MATLGLDTSAYEAGVRSVQSETKKTVATLSSEYTKATKRVAELAKAYAESAEKSGKSSKATKELKTQLNAAQSEVKTLASALKSANSGMVNFSSQAKSTGGSLTSAFTKANLLSTAISKIGSAALSAAKNFVAAGVTYNMQMETYEVALTNLLGSAEEAADVLETIKRDAAVTPFDVDSLISANRYLISSGENADYARKTVLALGDAVSAAGGGSDELNRMAQNLQQVANQGKATSVDIKQFAMAGINIYQILADYTGQSIEQVQEMTVTYDVLTQALIAAADEGGAYFDSMNTQAETTSGKIATLKDNFSQFQGMLTENVTPALNGVVDWLNEVVIAANNSGSAIGGLKQGFQSLVDWYARWKLSDEEYKEYLRTGGMDYDRSTGATAAEYRDAQNRKYRNEEFQRQVAAGLWEWDENDGWKPVGSTGSSIKGNGGGGDVGSGKTSTETVIRSLSGTVTSKTLNELGAVTQTVTTLSEKVKDETGKIKDRITQTTTETGKELVNGVETTYKTVTTKVNGEVTKVTKTYDDMSKSVAKTLVNLATQTIAGVTKSVQTSTTIAADGSESITETVTETWEEVVDGVAQTYTRVTKYIDGIVDNVQESCEEVERTVKATQERIDGYLSKAQSESGKGFFGLVSNVYGAIKSGSWSDIARVAAQAIFGEVDQGQREIIVKWAGDAMALINESYAGEGITGVLTSIIDLFRDGIIPAANEAGASVAGFKTILEGLTASGGAGAVLGNIGQMLMQFGSQVVSFVVANPEIAAIAAIVAGVAGLGVYLWKRYKKASDTEAAGTSSGLSYKDIQDAYWYGNERAFAGYDFRVDPYTYNPNNSAVLGYQTKMQEQVQRLLGVVEQYLPDVAKAQIVLDDGTLVGAMASGMDQQLGNLAILTERGN